MNKKFKTVIAALLAAAMCASFTGCDNRSDLEKELDKAAKEFDKQTGNAVNSSTTPSKPDPKPIDPFEDLEVVFEGISPLITAKLKGENSNVKYTLSRNRELENGGKVTVTAEIPSYKKDDYVLTSDSKEFTVSNRPYYIMKLSDLTDEDVQKLGKIITDLVPDDVIRHAAGGEGTTVNSLDFLGNINLTRSGKNYRLYFVYKANVTCAKISETREYIFAAFFGNVYKEKDGTLVFTDGKPSYNSSGDLSLSLNGFYVGGAYASLDSLNSSISGSDIERESNIIS
ncbi:MAG: hypothetical protein K2N56_08985 [Oscillospiraceae bacterium]|nr:hypothetical protein [Oscillospiraceae bacterium]